MADRSIRLLWYSDNIRAVWSGLSARIYDNSNITVFGERFDNMAFEDGSICHGTINRTHKYSTARKYGLT